MKRPFQKGSHPGRRVKKSRSLTLFVARRKRARPPKKGQPVVWVELPQAQA